MSYGLEIFKVIIALITVLGLFYLTVKFLKTKRDVFQKSREMEVLERCYLTNEKVLYLVKIIDKAWLVSTTKDKTEFIEEVDLSKIDLEGEGRGDLLNSLRKGKG